MKNIIISMKIKKHLQSKDKLILSSNKKREYYSLSTNSWKSEEDTKIISDKTNDEIAIRFIQCYHGKNSIEKAKNWYKEVIEVLKWSDKDKIYILAHTGDFNVNRDELIDFSINWTENQKQNLLALSFSHSTIDCNNFKTLKKLDLAIHTKSKKGVFESINEIIKRIDDRKDKDIKEKREGDFFEKSFRVEQLKEEDFK